MLTTATLPTTESQQIDRLLAVARETIATVRYCWVATRAEDVGANARAVRSFAGVPDGDAWTRRFLARRGSRKVAEIHRDPHVTLAYQADSGDAYVALVGRACVVEDRTEMHDLWYGNVATSFPDDFVEANMIVVRVEVDR